MRRYRPTIPAQYEPDGLDDIRLVLDKQNTLDHVTLPCAVNFPLIFARRSIGIKHRLSKALSSNAAKL
jgi:hypothetical protein